MVPAQPAGQTEGTGKEFGELAARLRGPLLLPADPGYDAARAVWNAMFDRRPAAVARCLGVADVVSCVGFARERGLTLSIKGGGHNVAGLAASEGGLMLDMSLMRGVWVDPAARTARAQAGCLLGDVDRETQLHGLATVLGFVSETGIAGLTLGGGFGYLTRRFGYTVDNVISMNLVTADGRPVHASDTGNPDLFWGLRGGGGNFGVVTSFEYRLHPVGPEVMGGTIAWRGEDAPEVLEMYRVLAKQAPPELTVGAVLRRAPPAPWLPTEIHGKPVVILLACDTGPIEEGEKRLAAIKAFGSPVADTIRRRSYVSQQSIMDATQPFGRRHYWKSGYLPEIRSEMLEKLTEHARHMVSPHTVVILFALDGALNRLPEDYGAVDNRNAGALLNIAASWEMAADDEANVKWAHAAWEDLRRFSTGGAYVNFLASDEGDRRIRSAYGGNYNRLVEAKTKWDPANLFHTNQNVAPRGTA